MRGVEASEPLLAKQGGHRAFPRSWGLGVASLAAVAPLAVAVLSPGSSDPRELYQVGANSFSRVSRMSVEDMAYDVRRMLAMEKKTLDAIDQRAKKKQKVEIDITAGQVCFPQIRACTSRCSIGLHEARGG
jgi:hypothetical protein